MTRILLVLAILLLSGRALATPPDPDTEVARRHHDRGADLYRESDYAGALAEFEAARVARALPELNYNIARCLDRLERWEEAADAYERYAESHPTDEAEVRERTRVLRERVAPVALVAAPLPPPTRALPSISLGALVIPATTRASRWHWWVAGSTTAVVGGVAVGFGVGLRESNRVVLPATTDGHYTARFP